MMNTKISTNLTLLESMDTSALGDIQKALYLIHKEDERVDAETTSFLDGPPTASLTRCEILIVWLTIYNGSR